jgi:hypothetical protein
MKRQPVDLSYKELWTALHGMVFGAGFLLLFTGALASLWSLRSVWLTGEGATRQMRRLAFCTWTMAILAWLAVLLGTYVIYPWYRAKPPANATAEVLSNYPKFLLVSKPQTADWHEFGMEWKEHLAWFAPILATAVAIAVTRWPRVVLQDRHVRMALSLLLTACFFSASVAGLLGALINKAAPTR